MHINLKNKIFLFGIIAILILVSIPQNTVATTTDINNKGQENYQDTSYNDNGKGEWKTNYFCRIKASGYGFLDFEVLGTTLSFWIGPCRKVGLYIIDGYCKISGILGTDKAKELEADFFCGILFENDAGWVTESHMNGFALKCKYKIT